jgi:hypothetical protein
MNTYFANINPFIKKQNFLARMTRRKPINIDTLDSFIASSRIAPKSVVNMVIHITEDIKVKGDLMTVESALDLVRSEVGGNMLVKCIESTKYSIALKICENDTELLKGGFGMRSVCIQTMRIPYIAKTLR